jgi:hypothetical protein
MKDGSAVLSRPRTWDAFFADNHVAEFRRRLYLEVYGEEYPAELGTDGYITRSELRQMADAFHVGRSSRCCCAYDGCVSRPRKARRMDLDS